jgi:UDP-glucose 4-epimerase
VPRIIVTGACGSLGRRVTATLAAGRPDGEVVGLDVRDGGDLAPGVAFTAVDLAAPGSGADRVLAGAADGAASVVHLAWQTGDGPRGAAVTDDDANRVALARVLAAAAAGAVGHVLLVSSATVYGAWPDNRVPLTEDALLRPNPGFAFALAKAEAERVVGVWADAHPAAAVTVLRPAVTLGTPERPLYQALGATRVPATADAVRPVQYLHVDDLAAAVVLCVERQVRGVFNVAPDAGVEESTARALAGGVATFTLPRLVARPLAALGWDLWRRGAPREVHPYTVHPWVVAPDRLKGEGWVPRYTTEEALVATDDRPHLDDLPPGRRQNLALLAGVGALAGAGGLAAGAVWRLHRRR